MSDPFLGQRTTLPLKIGDMGGIRGAGYNLLCCTRRFLCVRRCRRLLLQNATLAGAVALLSASVAFALASPSSAAPLSYDCRGFSGESLSPSLFLFRLTKLFSELVPSCLRRWAVTYAKCNRGWEPLQEVSRRGVFTLSLLDAFAFHVRGA